MPAPGQYLPRNSGPHRIACIALYRSLLEQCTRIPLPTDLPSRGPINPLKHFIRKKFRQNAAHASPRLVVLALEAGYAAEELLHTASTGNDVAIHQIHDVLRTLHKQTLSARNACTQPPSPQPLKDKALLRAHPGAPKVVDVRPLPLSEISGIRHVPTLTMANYLPFLRFKRPQSPYLSRVLTRKIRQKQMRSNAMDRLELLTELGESENDWEDIVLEEVEKDMGAESRQVMELEREGWGWDEAGGWRFESEGCRRMYSRSLEREHERAGKLGIRLIKVVEKEKELWEVERRERRWAKKAVKRLERGEEVKMRDRDEMGHVNGRRKKWAT